MKIKTKRAISEIIKKILNEMPLPYDPHQSTIDRRMYKNTLKDKYILKYPNPREIDHEMMRIKTLWVPRPQQYLLRLTKITNPNKMYTAYITALYFIKKNPEYKEDMQIILDKMRWYLRKNGYGDMLVGKGGKSPLL